MSILEEILDFNQEFVASGEYAQFFSNKYPERELAILSCMDARMVELLPRALGLKNGDAKLIKNAGAVVTHPWGSVMRSLLVAVLATFAFPTTLVLVAPAASGSPPGGILIVL